MVGVDKLEDGAVKVLGDSDMAISTIVSLNFATAGFIGLGGAIPPIMYFNLAGLYPFGFSNDVQEFLLAVTAILTASFFYPQSPDCCK